MKLSIDDKTIESLVKEATKEYLQEHGLMHLMRDLIKQQFKSWVKQSAVKTIDHKIRSLHSRVTHLGKRIKKLEGEEYSHIPED